MGQATSSPFTYTLEPEPERSYSGVGQLFQARKTAASGKKYPPVSVFVLQDDKGKSEVYAREIRRLRSPDLIRFIDRQAVADKIWLVTESVVPLEAVRESLTHEQLMLAVERTLHALQFLHSHARLSHNNVCLACMFVHRNRDLGNVATFKLGGLENCSNRPSSDGKLSTHPQPPESPAVGKRPPTHQAAEEESLPIHCRDIWQLGFVLPQVLDTGNGIDAVGRLAQAMRNPDPSLRPTAAKVLQDSFFASDSFLKTFSFLFSFRAHSPAAKRAFFAHLESLLGRTASRDLTESLMPLLTQTDVVVDAEAQAFWVRLFADGARTLKSKSERLECGIAVSDFCDSVVPQVVELLNSEARASKAAAMLHLPRLLGLLPGKVILSLVLPNMMDCLKDCDRGLCCAALDMCDHLATQWIARKDEDGLAAINSQVLIELRSLALDKDAAVRQRVMEVISKLVLLYEKINGMLGIRVLVGALGDPEPAVVNAALEAIERLKGLMTSVVAVNVVLPGLVPLLLSKHEGVRKQALGLITYLTHLVAQAKDIKMWPDAAPIPTPLVGSTRRKNLFVGALVDSPATPQRAKRAEKRGGDEEEEEEEEEAETDGGQWAPWKDELGSRSPRIAAPPPPSKAAEFFAGLQLKKDKSPNMTRSTAVIDFAKPEAEEAAAGTRQARSKSEEAVVPSEKPVPVVVEGPVKEPVRFVAPSPRKRAELPAKPPVVVPPPISPPNKRRADELNELLKQKDSSEEETEPVVFGGVMLDNESDSDGDSEDDKHDGMLDMVLQSQKMRSDIIATRGGVTAIAPVEPKKKEKKEEPKPKSKLFDLDVETPAPKEGGGDEEGGGWGDFELPPPE